jgi:NAD+ synthase (glutamine-hydrolysing)
LAETPLAAHVAVASINQTVGDWDGNERRITRVIEEARRRGARLLVLPEMCIPGYSLGDRLLMGGTVERSWHMLESLLPSTDDLAVMLGLPVRHGDVLYNCVAVVANGSIHGLVPKENLATGDVQYENRWFAGWQRGRAEVHAVEGAEIPFGSLLFTAAGLGSFGVEICEDGWKGTRPGSLLALAGAQILANPSASWFTLGKHRIRRAMVEQLSREDHVAYLYTSLLGCDATRLVFDGTVLLAQNGELLEEGRRFLFTESHEMVDRVLDLAAIGRARTGEGSWREQVESMHRGDYGEIPPTIEIEGDFSTPLPAPAPLPYWREGLAARAPDPSLGWLHEAGLLAREPKEQDLPHLELELGLCMALREYRAKCGIRGFALALSGGRDSAMCAILVGRMFRYDRPDLADAALRAHVREGFSCAYLATENSGEQTRRAAHDIAAEVGAAWYDADLQPALDTHLAIAKKAFALDLSWTEAAHDIPLQNVQARLRGSLIWLLANVQGFLLITTSNKSEAAVGYTTMDGDTCGGIAPLADVPKSLIFAWLEWAARFHGLRALDGVNQVPSTAELRPRDRLQTDEDDLLPFAVLDQLMFLFVQRGQEPLEMFRTLWPAVKDVYYAGDAAAFAAHVRKFVRMFCGAQWKRERFAISFRVTAFDLDPKTGFRFPPVQAPFTRELDELDAYVSQLSS